MYPTKKSGAPLEDQKKRKEFYFWKKQKNSRETQSIQKETCDLTPKVKFYSHKILHVTKTPLSVEEGELKWTQILWWSPHSKTKLQNLLQTQETIM